MECAAAAQLALQQPQMHGLPTATCQPIAGPSPCRHNCSACLLCALYCDFLAFWGSANSDSTTLLLQEIATAEGKKAALEMGARAVREEHEDLQRELETVQLSVEAAKADVATAQRELRTLRDKVCTPASLGSPVSNLASCELDAERCSLSFSMHTCRLHAYSPGEKS